MGARLAKRPTSILLIALALVVAFCVSGFMATSAAAGTVATPGKGLNFRGGPGHPGTVVAHQFLLNGRGGYCIDFPRHNPDDSGSFKLPGNVPGMNAEESAQAKKLNNQYAHPTSNSQAANVTLAIWTLQHEREFTTWWKWARHQGIITAARAAAVANLLDLAKQHGPYQGTVNVAEALVGQTTSGTVKVLASNGKPAAGVSVKLNSSANTQVTPTTATTNRAGIVRFTQHRTNLGTVSITAVITGPSSKMALLSLPSVGNQRLIQGTFNESAKANVQYEKQAGAVTIKSVCDTDCNGMSTVTFSYCNEAGASTIHWMETVGGVGAVTLDVAGGACAEKSIQLGDGTQVASSYCYLGGNGSCATAVVTLPGTYEVVCPAWVKAFTSLNCDCKGATAQVILKPPADSPRFSVGFVAVNGTVVKTVSLVNGQDATVDLGSVKVGDNVSVSFTVYRDAAHTQELVSHKLCGSTVTE